MRGENLGRVECKHVVTLVGPGLAIRIICAARPFITDTYAQTHTNIQTLVARYLEEHDVGGAGEKPDIRSTLLPIRTVGVQGKLQTAKRQKTLQILQATNALTHTLLRSRQIADQFRGRCSIISLTTCQVPIIISIGERRAAPRHVSKNVFAALFMRSATP